MAAITDDFMRDMLAKSSVYSLVLLKPTARPAVAGTAAILWEHARRNFQLRADGVLAIVGPVTEPAAVSGIGIFKAPIEQTRQIMDGDPAVQAGIFTYEVYPFRSFPDDRL